MTSLLAVAVVAASPGLTLAEVRTMPVGVAGDRLLAELPHGPIVAIRDTPVAALPAPGSVGLELDERPIARTAGCAFRRWRATFRRPQGASEAESAIDGRAYPIWHVALAGASGCASTPYAYVNPGIDPDRALRTLAGIADIARRRPRSVTVTCRTEIRSDLCDDRSTLLRRAIARGPWLVTDGGATVLYGVPGQVPVRVAVTGDPVRSIAVAETVPAPF